jgi:hypothetical protein
MTKKTTIEKEFGEHAKRQKEIYKQTRKEWRLILDIGKNATGKTTRYLEELKESKESFAFVVNNHKHGKEKEEELKSKFPNYTDFVYLEGLEYACPEFYNTDENGNKKKIVEMEATYSFYHKLGFSTRKVHEIVHGVKDCHYVSQWDVFYNSLPIKKAVITQQMLLSGGGLSHNFRRIVFDETDGILGFKDEVKPDTLEKIRFDREITLVIDPEDSDKFPGEKFEITLKEVDKKFKVNYKKNVEKLQKALNAVEKSIGLEKLSNSQEYKELTELLEYEDIINTGYLIKETNEAGQEICRKFPLFTVFLLSIVNKDKIFIPNYEETVNLDENLEPILPEITIASARMRDNFLMKSQLQITFELAKFLAKNNDEKLQIQHLWERKKYLKPEYPDKEKVKTNCYVVDPKKNYSGTQARNNPFLLLSDALIFRKKMLERYNSVHNPNGFVDKTPFILIMKKEVIGNSNGKKQKGTIEKLRAKQEKMRGKGNYKRFEEFLKMLDKKDILLMYFGSTSAGSNPDEKYKYIFILGDWINGEYHNMLRYLTFDGKSYNEYTTSSPLGMTIKKTTPEAVKNRILDIMALEIKEYILLSRYKRPVFFVSHLIASNFQYFQKLYSNFNIDMKMLVLKDIQDFV